MRKVLPPVLLLLLGMPAAAQDSTRPDTPPAAPGSAATAGQVDEEDGGRAPADGSPDESATPAIEVEPATRFEPTEQIDEDFSIAFPVDI